MAEVDIKAKFNVASQEQVWKTIQQIQKVLKESDAELKEYSVVNISETGASKRAKLSDDGPTPKRKRAKAVAETSSESSKLDGVDSDTQKKEPKGKGKKNPKGATKPKAAQKKKTELDPEAVDESSSLDDLSVPSFDTTYHDTIK